MTGIADGYGELNSITISLMYLYRAFQLLFQSLGSAVCNHSFNSTSSWWGKEEQTATKMRAYLEKGLLSASKALSFHHMLEVQSSLIWPLEGTIVLSMAFKEKKSLKMEEWDKKTFYN